MLIVGVFYGIILYNKSHTPSQTVVGNLSVTGEVIPGIKAGLAHNVEWEGLKGESSHLGQMDHEEISGQALIEHNLNAGSS